MFVDSHCHLNFSDYHGRIDAIRADMAAAGVTKALCISTTLERFDEVHQLALDNDNFWASAGVHPDEEGVQEPTTERLIELAALPKVVAIGETGLDYYRVDSHEPPRTRADMQWQRERFVRHIEAALVTNKPLVIHTRSASDDTLAILRDYAPVFKTQMGGKPGVFHCFTETQAVAEAGLELGFYISFSGILTFKNAKDLKAIAQAVPLERTLIETDSPYLAPTPHRGKVNSPAWVPFVAEELARLKGVSVEAVGEATTQNFEDLFFRR